MSIQGRFWLLTIPLQDFGPIYLPAGVTYLKGQIEQGEGGFKHWQLFVVLQRKLRLRGIKDIFGDRSHCELSRSQAASTYVWKDETGIPKIKILF